MSTAVWPDCAENAFLAKHDFVDGVIVTQAIHNEIGVPDSICWRFCHARAFPGECFAFLGASIPNGELVAAFEKIGRRTAPHRTEAKIRNFPYHFSTTRGLFTLVYLPYRQRDQRGRH